MFKDALRDIVDRTDGGLAGIVMDSAGIPVETYAKDGAPIDINAIGVEFGTLLGSIKRAAEMLEAGAAQEVSISTEKMIAVIRMLNESYFIAVAMSPDGNLGKGRYLMRTAAPRLRSELS
jgi:predicted regulator of Ras-like GTPase activity (Roadblock/LC7/MglB family)